MISLFDQSHDSDSLANNYSAKWRCPSNIAIVKYWGKKLQQLPCNASVSFTLNNAYTNTEIIAKKSSNFSVQFYLERDRNIQFEQKIEAYFLKIAGFLPFIQKYSFQIISFNSFPHSSGIASSASGFGALALGLLDIAYQILNRNIDTDFYRYASYLARLGSGSASRSIYGGLVMWGKHKDFPESSDEYATAWKTNKDFLAFKDYILLIDKGQKEVSSTLGHSLMNDHPFSTARFSQAKLNLVQLHESIENKQMNRFISLAEEEALSLHAMMMTSQPYFMLFKPNTVAAIQEIWRLRKATGIKMFFTLDAGANVHLLVHQSDDQFFKDKVLEHLTPFCNNSFIEDEVGAGPQKL